MIEPDESRDRAFLGLLWNDPTEGALGFGHNDYRGYMRTFGSRVFHEFCDKNGIERFVRGHQRWPDGYRYFFDEKLLSIFSCASYSPDVRTKAAIVEGSNLKIVDL